VTVKCRKQQQAFSVINNADSYTSFTRLILQKNTQVVQSLAQCYGDPQPAENSFTELAKITQEVTEHGKNF